MLRIHQVGNMLPTSFIVDPSAEFMPGMAAQLTVIGNQVMATVSDGSAPIGVIDEIRTKAFSSVSWNEVIIVPADGVLDSQNQLVTAVSIKAELANPNISASSFISTVKVNLNPRNGVIEFLPGTVLNYDLTGEGYPNAIRTIVNYTYQIPNIPGDDSTLGSGRMTVWFGRMFISTDQYETNQVYPVNRALFISETGLFTTRRPSEFHPMVAIVTGPPTSSNAMLELLWL